MSQKKDALKLHYGHINADQESGISNTQIMPADYVKSDGFLWERDGNIVIITCTGYHDVPKLVNLELDEPWASETVLVPHPVMASAFERKSDQEGEDYDEDEVVSRVASWVMLESTRNAIYVKKFLPGLENSSTKICVTVFSLPDVKTKEAFDHENATEIRAGFGYIIHF